MRKQLIKSFSFLFPNLFVNFAYKQLTNPQVKKLRVHEIETLDTSIQNDFIFNDFTIKTYHWKGGPKSILLIHGWEGQAGNFSDFIILLKKQNYTIYAFDGPSHGFSSKGPTSLFEFTQLVGVLIKKYKVKNLVSHSFGGVATSFALSSNPDLLIDKYLLFTTPDKFSQRIEQVRQQVGITLEVKKRLIEKLEKEMDVKVSELNVSEFVKKVSVEKAMIIHDKNDKVIPIEQSINVDKNWETCSLKKVEGTGHFRILRTPEILEMGIRFLDK